MNLTLDNAEQQFAAAYDEYADAIFRHCYFRVFDRERGKEIMQEVFMKTWEYVASGHTIENVRAFLYKTANHLVIDEARKRKRRKVVSLEDMQEKGFDPGSDEDIAALKEQQLDAQKIIAVLSQIEQPYRDVLIMRYIDGLQPGEIAQLMNESANAISVRLNRGMKKLRSLLPDE